MSEPRQSVRATHVEEAFMREALEEAARGVGRTSPNPRVGAVLVKDGRIIARGYHSRAGAPHAEVMVIRKAGSRARGADLYTTLEPCDHFGRTPPCTYAIIQARIRRVICATVDRHPLVNGRGIARLKKNRIPVKVGVLEEEAILLNRPFFKAVKSGLPWVTLKAAISLDGKIATRSGASRWISGKAARARVHHLRNQVDAILIGANTARLDNPRLTTRIPGRRARDAARVVLDSRLRLPETLRLFRQRSKAPTIVATLRPPAHAKVKRLSARGVEVWTLPSTRGRVNLRSLMERLARAGFLHVLAEGGALAFGSLLRAGLVDEVLLFLTPKLIGAEGLTWTGPLGVRSVTQALQLSDLEVERVDGDLLLRGCFPKNGG